MSKTWKKNHREKDTVRFENCCTLDNKPFILQRQLLDKRWEDVAGFGTEDLANSALNFFRKCKDGKEYRVLNKITPNGMG